MKIAKSIVVAAIMVIGVGIVSGQTTVASPSATPETVLGADFKRWVDVSVFSAATRYRYVRANNDIVLANQMQWQFAIKTRFKFDKAGRYSVNAGVQTGTNFTSSWNNLGPGTGELQTNIYVKQLYFAAKPIKELELQVGGINVNNGENSEVTGYDNDNYITGERVTVRAPKKIYFDEVSATNAYLGDLTRPNVFGRLHRLNEANYHQLLLRKQVTRAAGVSADYTFADGTDTIREAVRIRPNDFFLDTILFDAYQRVSTPDGCGFNIFGEKVVNERVTVNGGFARIDDLLRLNGDRFPPGKRLYTSLLVKLRPDLTLSPVLIGGIGDLPTPTSHRMRFEFVLNWNVLETLRRHRVL